MNPIIKKNNRRNLILGFKHAFNGIMAAFRKEANLRIHVMAVFIVVLFSFATGLDVLEWCIVILCMALVITAELFNTAVENLADVVTREYDPHIKVVKDIAAGAVLIASIASVIIGAIVFLPKLW